MVCGCSAFRRFCNISGDILPQNQCTHAEQLVVEILYTIADDQMTLLRSFLLDRRRIRHISIFGLLNPMTLKVSYYVVGCF